MAIIQRKNGAGGVRYLVRVRDSYGKWYAAGTFERRTYAAQYERLLLSQRDRGGLAPTAQQKEMTFADYWTVWSAECRGRVSEGWKGCQNRMARRYMLPFFGQRKFGEIRSVDVGQYMAYLERKGLSPQSALHGYNILHKMFEDAVEFHELVPASPVKRRFRPRLHLTERNFLSPVESWKLLEAAREHSHGVPVWISLLSGLRPGEVQALRWDAIDFDREQILIRATFNKKMKVIQDHPKQKDWGRAPMPKPLSEFLRPKRREPGDFVCTTIHGKMLNYESFVSKVLPKLCIQAGVKRITPHELRHSCTELYVEAGASAEDLRRLLNHKSLSATLRYMHRTDGRLAGIAEKIRTPTLAIQ